MKLDKLQFGLLVAYIGELQQRQGLNGSELNRLDEIIDIQVPVISNKVAEEDVNELLRQIVNPDGFINAIKAYRVLTGAGLKESKEAIEKYRSIPKCS